MDKNSLRDHFTRLRAQIAEAHQDHPETAAPANHALGEIQRLIDASRDAPHPSIPDRLESLAVQFEADHPTLAASTRRLIDLLGEVGI